MASSTSRLPEKPIQTEPLITDVQDLILEYVADDITESKSIYTAENRCTLFESGPQDKSYNKLALHFLLHHVVCGKQMQVEAIIKAHPELLFEFGSVNDLSGNTFVSFSPVKLARFAHDDEMLAMMKLYVNNVDGGTEKFAAILKEATEYEAKTQETYDVSGIVTAITSANEEQRTGALNNFRQTLAPRVIKHSENSYNIKNLSKAYEVYESHYTGWSDNQRLLFWCQVIGFLQRSLPACYAQAFCQGIYCDMTKAGKPLERSLKLYNEQNFYPSDLSVSRGLGFGFGMMPAIVSGDGHAVPRPSGVLIYAPTVAEAKLEQFRSLCKAKTTALHELMQLPSNQASKASN